MVLTGYLAAQQKAHQQYNIANHLVGVSYPLLKDNKLLLGAATNLFLAMSSALEALLSRDHQLGLIPSLPEGFEGRLALFSSRCLPRYQVDQKYLEFLLRLKEIQDWHQQGPVEFQRRDKYVLCTRDYRLKTLTAKSLQEHLALGKEFLEVMDKILAR